MTVMMIVIASGQTNLPKGRIATTHRQFTRIRQVSPVCTPSNTCFLGPSRVHVPNSISIGSAIFAESPYTLQWAAHSPLKTAPSHRGICTPSNTSKRLVSQFSAFCRAHNCDRQTDQPTDRPPYYSVCNNCPYLYSLRSNNRNNSNNS